MSTHYALRGGLSSNGIYCGTFFVFVYVSTGAADWTIGAALSFKLLMIIYHSNNKFIEGDLYYYE